MYKPRSNPVSAAGPIGPGRRATATVTLLLLIVAVGFVTAHVEATPPHPVPRVMALGPALGPHVPIVQGSPATVSMQSGQVTLTRGASSGRHSTGEYEELLVVLEGKGEIIISGKRLPIIAECAAYLPPRTLHDVHNAGSAVLRYVYVAARAVR